MPPGVFVEQQESSRVYPGESGFYQIEEDATLLVTDAVSAVNKLDGEEAFPGSLWIRHMEKDWVPQVLEALQGTTLG